MQRVLPILTALLLLAAGFFFSPKLLTATHTTIVFPIPTISVPSTDEIRSQIDIRIRETTQQIEEQKTSIRINGIEQSTTPSQPTILPSSTPSPTQTTRSSNTPTPTPNITQPTSTAAPLRVLTVAPTANPTTRPTNTPTPTRRVTATPIQSNTDDKQTYIMNAINSYRASKGLASVRTSSETCQFASIRAQEIARSFNHDGFRNRINTNTIPYNNWSLITENIAMTSNYKNVVTMWSNSPGHAANMQKDTPFVCVEDYGNYYAYEGMRP